MAVEILTIEEKTSLSFTCPRCHAKPQNYCTLTNTTPLYNSVHWVRIQASQYVIEELKELTDP